MSRSARNPTNWDEYQYGTSYRSSVSSAGGRSIRFEDHERSSSPAYDLPDTTGEERHDTSLGPALRRRGSSVVMHLNALTQVGGVNSIGNFARSWQRAAEFVEVAPNRPSFVLASDSGDDDEQYRYRRTDIQGAPVNRTSLLRQHLEASSQDQGLNQGAGDEVADRPAPDPLERSEIDKYQIDSEFESGLGSVRSNARPSHSIFAIAPHLATPFTGSYGTSYGTLQSASIEPSMASAVQLWRQQQAAGATVPDRERQPLIVKEVEQDGKIVLVVEGQSTLPQTVFNSINVLIGVGLLSLPLGMKYSGWICGMVFLILSALVTSYTAMLLAKCMDVDVSLITFADLAFVSYGQKARIATGLLFLMELLAACVALIVLFADTLDLLIPGVGVIEWKILAGLFLIPLNFAPLRLLSFTSVVGIFSCSCSKSKVSPNQNVFADLH
jgi:solute carrier family 32 (vesicular inhibitory amino acid transporter)